MSISKRFVVWSLFVFVLACTARAQEQRAPLETPAPTVSGPLVTVTASERRVRFVSPGTVVQLRLEVYNEAGRKLFDTELRGGNVLDWHLQDGTGERLPAGSYACVLTVKSLSGRLSQRMGMVTVTEKAAVAQGTTRLSQLSIAQQQTIGPVEGNAAFTVRQETAALTAVTHDGTDGQLTSTAGALTFRTGDVFAAQDKEHMRITPEGRVGIGTDKPEATLDVAGSIRTTTLKTADGVEFADGSRLNSKDGKLVSTNAAGEPQEAPNVAGTGTTDRLVKWTDGAAGTLGDSLLGESGNGVELRSPVGGAGFNPTFVNPNNIAGFALLQAYPASGTNANQSLQVVPRGTGVMNNRAQITVFNTDFIADASNYEFSSLRARGTDFVFGTGKSGTGVNRPLMFAAGFLSDNTTNNNQLFLAADGNVGVGVNNPTAKLQVAGTVNFTGLRTEAGSTPNVIGGRSTNSVTPGVIGATIGGGDGHTVRDTYGTIGGGEDNNVGDGGTNLSDRSHATVAGGLDNSATGSISSIGGGISNSANGSVSTIGGGEDNSTSGQEATVGGGFSNNAFGQAATVPGGSENSAVGDYSFAAGHRANANHIGTFVWSDSGNAGNLFTSSGNNQFLIRAAGGVGINTNITTGRALSVTGNTKVTGNLELTGAMTVDATTLVVDSANNRVGVGTALPSNLLHVSGAGTGAGGCCGATPAGLEVVGHFVQPAGTAHSAISVDAATGRDSVLYFAENGSAVWGFRNDADANDKFDLRYHGAGVGDDSTAWLTVLSGGNVGIGTTSPQRKLHISDAMRLQPIASPPASAASGDLYFDSSEALCVFVSGAWSKLAGAGTCN